MSYPPPPGGQPGWDPNQQPPQQPGWNPSQPQPPQPGQPPQQSGYPAQQPGWNPNQPPPQQPGYPPQQPGQPSQPPGMGQQPGMPPQGQPGGYPPQGGMPPGAPGGYPQQPPPKKGGTGLIIGIGAGALALVVGLVLIIAQPWGGSSGPGSSDDPEDVTKEILDLSGSFLQGDASDLDGFASEIRPYLCSSAEAEFDDVIAEAKRAQEEIDNLPDYDFDDLDLGDEFDDLTNPNDVEFPDPNLDYTITDSSVDGDNATVNYEVSFDNVDYGSGDTTRETSSGQMSFEKEDGAWLLCDDMTSFN